MALRSKAKKEVNLSNRAEDESDGENSKDDKKEKDKSQSARHKTLGHGTRLLKDITNLFHDYIIPERNVVFCIDTSGSTYHILDTVKEHLVDTITKHASKENSPFFNIIQFNTTVTVWCDKMVPCTDSTVKVAKRWINSLAAKTGTNTRDALLAAFDFSECEAVYLVSDGLPDCDMDELLDSLAYANRGRPVNVIYICEREEDAKVRDALRQIAQETFGNFRVVAFGVNGPLQRTSLVLDEPPMVKKVRTKQGSVYPDEPMCGVRVYDAGTLHSSRAIFDPKYTDQVLESGYAQPTALGSTQDPLRDPLVRPSNGSARPASGDMDALLRDSLWPGTASGTALPSGDALQPRPPPSATWSRYRPSRAFIAAKEKQFREFDQASKCPIAGALLIGKTVLCRMDDKHAYYRKGNVRSQVRENVYLVELPAMKSAARRDPQKPDDDYVPTDYHEVTAHNVIAYDDALRHRVKRGDRVLAPIGLDGRLKFLPGTVTDGEEWREPLCVTHDRPLSVLFDNGKTHTVPPNTAILITEDTFRRLTLEAKMPPNARASLQSVAGYPERSLPGYPVDPLPREPREYAHAKPSVVQPGNGLFVDHLTPAYHLPIHPPATDCNCHEPQPDCVNHAFSLDTVEQHARTERDYPSDDEKRLHALKPKKVSIAPEKKTSVPSPPPHTYAHSRHVHSAKTFGHQSPCSTARCDTHRRASFDALDDLERKTSEYKHDCESSRRPRRSSLDALHHSDSDSDYDSSLLDEARRTYLRRKLKRDYLDDMHTYVDREEAKKSDKAKTAGWYNEAVRVIHRTRSASGESCSSHSSTSSPRFDTAEIEKQLLKVRKRIRKVKLAYGSDGEEKSKHKKRGRSRSRSRSTERRKRSPSSSSSSSDSSDSECQHRPEMSAREQQANDKIRRKELERLLQRRRKARGQTSSRSGSEVRIDRMQLRNKPVQVGPPAKPPWRYWRNDPPPTLLAPPTFDAYRDVQQPVNSVELHPVRASSAKLAPKAEKTGETKTRKQQGYMDREQQILQRRFEEAMRREEEQQEKRASRYDQRNSDALRTLNPEASQAKFDKERSAIRDRILREYSSKRSQVMEREMTAELQREAARTKLAAERAAAQAVLDKRRAEQHAQAVRERNQGDQQLRLARVACEEAARMHSELSRTNAETAQNLRKYEVRKEVNQGYLNKLRVDPARS